MSEEKLGINQLHAPRPKVHGTKAANQDSSKKADMKALIEAALKHPVSFMYALMEAVDKDQSTLSRQQIEDAQTTQLMAKLQQNILQYWNDPISGKLQKDLDAIQEAIKKKKSTNKIQLLQKEYSADSTRAQGQQDKQSGMIQSTQGQTSADAQNMSMKANMVQGTNSIMSTLANMLGRVTA